MRIAEAIGDPVAKLRLDLPCPIPLLRAQSYPILPAVETSRASFAEATVDLSGGHIDGSRPLGVYIHFPFCTARCPYCDFATAVRPEIPHDSYADAVLAELKARAPWFQTSGNPPLASIYFGGGTPGRWRPDALGRVLGDVQARFGDGADVEITVEANPGDLKPDNLHLLRALGVNRLSLGAQAFQDHLLARLGRNHSAAAIAPAFQAARSAGFDNLCADLMFGLPDQTLTDWQGSLDAMCALAPDHITAYALTVEAGTPFGVLERAGKLQRPGDDTVATMYAIGHDRLTAAGYEHYEISSYARPGRRSVHNSLYWTLGAYLGVGVSASSFRPLTSGEGWRFSNPRSLGTYLRQVSAHTGAVPPAQLELRTSRQIEDEALWLALRMSDGVDRASHRQRHGIDPLDLPERQAAAQSCVAAGWLEITPEILRLLPAGFLFADEVAVRLSRNRTT